MKRVLLLLAVFVTGLGALIYLTDSNTKPDTRIVTEERDSIQGNQKTDSISNKINPLKKSSKKSRVPKTVRSDQYAYLDKYARETPAKYSQNKVELAEYLKKPAKNDLEKARLLYSWIATHIHYDDESFNTGIYKSQNADSALVRGTAVCEGFSSIFQELGLLMDLEVEKISGYSKGYGYRPGKTFSTTNHAWNAVKIADTWELIDVTWGSSDSETTNKGLKSAMRLDPYWFCVSPEAFIFSHFPENEDWQLISQKITLKQYETLPFLHDSFFKLGFAPKNVFQKAISGDVQEFVETFPVDFPIDGTTLPLSRKIQRDNECTFLIESEYLESVMIIDGGKWIELKKEGNLFKLDYAPTGKELKLSVKINSYDKTYWTIAAYEIVTDKALANNQ